MDALKIENLYFHYHSQKVLENISFELNSKDFLAIIGPNGGGKTTLVKLILGLLNPKKGSIKIFGKTPKESISSITYVPQYTNTNSDFPIRVLDVVLMGCLKKGVLGRYEKEDYIKAKEALKQVGMSEFENSKLSRLSGGQRQRVFIARALCVDAKMILLDEPTASIDIEGQKHIFELLQLINKKMSVIVVSHDINVVLGYATKIAHINKTIYMHDAPSLKVKKNILKTLNSAQGHLCPVELVGAGVCKHPSHNESLC